MLQKRASFLFSFIKMFPKLSKKGGVGGGGGGGGDGIAGLVSVSSKFAFGVL